MKQQSEQIIQKKKAYLKTKKKKKILNHLNL